MPTPATLERFIARVESNAHAEAIEEFYAENASMQENSNPPRVGRDHLVAHERQALARAASVKSTCVRPVFGASRNSPTNSGRARRSRRSNFSTTPSSSFRSSPHDAMTRSSCGYATHGRIQPSAFSSASKPGHSMR